MCFLNAYRIFISAIFPLSKRGNKGDFGNLPLPLFGKEGKHAFVARRNGAKGFTLIEIVMTILIASVLSVAGIDLMRFTIQNTFFLPNQVQADLVAAEALEIIVEGDSQAEGLRFCKAVTDGATASNVVVTNQDGVTITYELSGTTLYRTIGLNPPNVAAPIPYYVASNMVISGGGTAGALFTYYDSTDIVMAVPVATGANIHRIRIDLIAQQGTGSVDKFQGRSAQSTAITVYGV
ncbi:MAG: prepilin-type N-terminal cleavage/methylation domain-containing protein [Candidatus Omnitrophota bacterium]